MAFQQPRFGFVQPTMTVINAGFPQQVMVPMAMPSMSMMHAGVLTSMGAKQIRKRAPEPPPEKHPVTTAFIGNITEKASNDLVKKMLEKCGVVVNWKRIQGSNGKFQAFGFCEFDHPQSTLRALRLLHDWLLGDKRLVVKVDDKTRVLLIEFLNKRRQLEGIPVLKTDEEIPVPDDQTKMSDVPVRASLLQLMREYNIDHDKNMEEGEISNASSAYVMKRGNLEEYFQTSDQPDDEDRREYIEKEINYFRETYKDDKEIKRPSKRASERGAARMGANSLKNRDTRITSAMDAADLVDGVPGGRVTSNNSAEGVEDGLVASGDALSPGSAGRRSETPSPAIALDAGTGDGAGIDGVGSKPGGASDERAVLGRSEVRSSSPRKNHRDQGGMPPLIHQDERLDGYTRSSDRDRIREREMRDRERSSLAPSTNRRADSVASGSRSLKRPDRRRSSSRSRSPRSRSRSAENRRRLSKRKRSVTRSRSRSHSRRDRSRSRRRADSRSTDEEEMEERKRVERQLREKEAAYQERLRKWESRERKKQREREKDIQNEKQKRKEDIKEAKKLKEFLEDYDDERDDVKYYKGVPLQARRKEYEKECEVDRKDRQREKEELEEIKQRLIKEGIQDPELEIKRMQKEQEEKLQKKICLSSFSNDDSPVVLSAKKEPVQSDNERDSSSGSDHSDAEDDAESQNDSIPAPSQASPPLPPNPMPEPAFKPTEPASESEARPLGFAGIKFGQASGNTSIPQSGSKQKLFGDEDAVLETKNRKPLVRLDYSDGDDGGDDSPVDEPRPVILSADEKKRLIKQLIERIPTSKDELFAHPIDWQRVDQPLIEKRLRPWVNKKIIEYIGEEEKSLVDFICQKVAGKSDPAKILADVTMVLDDEAEVFVVKMWRLLIYEIEAKKVGLVKVD